MVQMLVAPTPPLDNQCSSLVLELFRQTFCNDTIMLWSARAQPGGKIMTSS